jgi:hypothetical protein
LVEGAVIANSFGEQSHLHFSVKHCYNDAKRLYCEKNFTSELYTQLVKGETATGKQIVGNKPHHLHKAGELS